MYENAQKDCAAKVEASGPHYTDTFYRLQRSLQTPPKTDSQILHQRISETEEAAHKSILFLTAEIDALKKRLEKVPSKDTVKVAVAEWVLAEKEEAVPAKKKSKF